MLALVLYNRDKDHSGQAPGEYRDYRIYQENRDIFRIYQENRDIGFIRETGIQDSSGKQGYRIYQGNREIKYIRKTGI